ncbi:hypothetical protein, partial [Neisseria cinerea]|uniref:hypothetical protein n=1 Tax=Neisseria cinerea TaxID=483 RepID=UPI002B1D8D21
MCNTTRQNGKLLKNIFYDTKSALKSMHFQHIIQKMPVQTASYLPTMIVSGFQFLRKFDASIHSKALTATACCFGTRRMPFDKRARRRDKGRRIIGHSVPPCRTVSKNIGRLPQL